MGSKLSRASKAREFANIRPAALLRRGIEHEGLPATGLFFGFNRARDGARFVEGIGLPPTPMVAYYFRRYSSLYQAFKAMEIDCPATPKRDGGPDWEATQIRRAAIGRLIESLGPRKDDCEGVLREITKISSENQERPVPSEALWQVTFNSTLLVKAYTDTLEFFGELAPAFFPPHFDPRRIGPFRGPHDVGDLGETLFVWGYAALLNPAVRLAFDAAARHPNAEYKMGKILGWAEAKTTISKRGGRPLGSKNRRRIDLDKAFSSYDDELAKRLLTGDIHHYLLGLKVPECDVDAVRNDGFRRLQRRRYQMEKITPRLVRRVMKSVWFDHLRKEKSEAAKFDAYGQSRVRGVPKRSS